MKRVAQTRRLPGGRIVTNHGEHDQKTHGNRMGSGYGEKGDRHAGGGVRETKEFDAVAETGPRMTETKLLGLGIRHTDVQDIKSALRNIKNGRATIFDYMSRWEKMRNWTNEQKDAVKQFVHDNGGAMAVKIKVIM